jgi:hypothetical protein
MTFLDFCGLMGDNFWGEKNDCFSKDGRSPKQGVETRFFEKKYEGWKL